MVRTSNGYTQCPGSDPGRGKAENEELGMLGSLKITLKIFLSQLVHTLCQINLQKDVHFCFFFYIDFFIDLFILWRTK